MKRYKTDLLSARHSPATVCTGGSETWNNKEQDRQCTYSVTLGRVHETIVAGRKAISITYFCACVRVGGEGGVGAWVQACATILMPLWLHQIFPHYLMNGTIFGTKLLNVKCVF